MAVTEAPDDRGYRKRRAVRKPRWWRYLLAAPLLLGGLGLALGVGFGAGQTKTDRAIGFARVAVPGALTLHVDHPATYNVFSEGTACLDYPNCHGLIYPVTVKVSGPSGPVKVIRTDGPTYMIGGSEGTGVARFDATTTGDYRVAAITGPYSQGLIAVGEAFPTWTQDWLASLAMVLLLAGGLLIIVVPIVVYGRRTRAAAP